MRAALLLVVLLLPWAPAGAAAQERERFLVSLDAAPDAAFAKAVAALDGRVLEGFPAARVALVEVPSAARLLLALLPGVAAIQEEEPLALLLSSSRPAVRVTQALWDAGYDGSGVVVAVVDSGIDGAHPGLQGRVARSVRFSDGGAQPGAGDSDGHGTHIAGIIAGDGAGSAGLRHAGMAPEATLVGVDISSSFTTTNAVRAFEWLHGHARELGLRVVSNSWGREREGAAFDVNDPVIRASDALVDAGIVVVFSAGNVGSSPGTLTVEAQNPRVLTVGAANDEGRVEAYSSRGPPRLAEGGLGDWVKPDVTAPGTLITSARANAGAGEAYAVLNGTSMAAPHVAGIAALMLEADPRLKPDEVKALLRATARDRGAPGPDMDNGAGFVDGQRAVQSAREGAGEAEPERAAFRDAGEVRPAASLLPQARVLGGEVRQPVVVPPGAVGLEFALRWDEPRAQFQVTLERAGRVFGPFAAAARDGAGMVLRVELAEPLEPGTWTLVAKPSGAALASKYELDGAVLVRHALPPVAAPEAAPARGFPALLSSEGAAEAAPPVLLMAAIAAPAGLALALGARRRRAK